MDTVKVKCYDTKIIAHRGLSGLEAENTASAFVAAGNRSYFGIETDVHKTADRKFILTHDDKASRVSGRNITIEKADFSTLRKIILFDKNGEKSRGDLIMPTPNEYFSICKKYDKYSVFEIKNDMEKEDIISLVKTAEKSNQLDKTIFISFSLDNLIKLKSEFPNQAAQYLVSKINDKVISALKKYSLDIDAYHSSLTKEIIKNLHSDGIKVNAWTVDDEARAKELISFGIDFLTTNIIEGI